MLKMTSRIQRSLLFCLYLETEVLKCKITFLFFFFYLYSFHLIFIRSFIIHDIFFYPGSLSTEVRVVKASGSTLWTNTGPQVMIRSIFFAPEQRCFLIGSFHRCSIMWGRTVPLWSRTLVLIGGCNWNK